MLTGGVRDTALGVEAGHVVVARMFLHREGRLETLPHVGKRHAVLRPLRSSDAGLYGVEVELEDLVKNRQGGLAGADDALLPRVALDEIDELAIPPGGLEVAQRLLVDREEGGGGAVLRAHVGDRGAIRNGKAREAGAAELDELVDHAVCAEHLG